MKKLKFKNEYLQEQYKKYLGLRVVKNVDDEYFFLDFGIGRECVDTFDYDTKEDMEHDYKQFKSLKSDVEWVLSNPEPTYDMFPNGTVSSIKKNGKVIKIYLPD